MALTYFQDFTRDDGSPITVEYEVEGSYSPTTYSPHSGADGGDAPIFGIIDAWPRTEEYNALWGRRSNLETGHWGGPLHPAFITPELREELQELDRQIEAAKITLTDAERERMEAWIAEHYVDDDEPSDWEF